MKIVIINHSDCRGGASVVSRRLMHALRALGHDATMLVAHKGTDDAHVVQAGPQWRLKAAFIAEHLQILTACGFDRTNLFKLSIATDGLALSRHPLVREADAVILNWINQGMLSLDEIKRIADAKPTLWTMHDMWNLTAVCHHAGECRQFTHQEPCSDCPMTGARMARRTARRKMKLYAGSGIRFVAVSSWLASLCAESTIMRGMDVGCIPNAFPVDDFYTEPRQSRSRLGLPEGKKLIVMGAARLDDPIKGLPYAVEALNGLHRDDAVAVFYGALRDTEALAGLKFPHIHLGTIGYDTVRELYAHADVVMSTSRYETLPGTLIEGQAAGCMPVSFDRGGQRDIIASPDDGFLVPAYDTGAFTAALDRALSSPPDRNALHRKVKERFSAEAVARRYLDLIHNTR